MTWWSDNASIPAVSVLAALSALVYYYCTSTFDKWERLGVPYVRPLVPLFGNFWMVAVGVEHTVDAYKRIYDRLAGRAYGGFYQLRTPFLMVRDPALVNRVLHTDASCFPDHGFYTDLRTNPLSNHLFFMEGSRWHTMRAKMSPAFSSSKLKAVYGQIKECSDELMRSIDGRLRAGDDRFDVRDVIGKYSTDVIGTCAFGIKMNAVSDDSSEFRTHGKRLLAPSWKTYFRVAFQMISPRLYAAMRFQDFPPDAVEFYQSAIRATFAYRETENAAGGGRQDLIHYLMLAKKDLVTDPAPDAKDVFTEMDITANAFFLFLAGFEAVSTILSMCLYELALRKDYQDRVREEITSKLAQHGGIINNDYVSDLNYMDKVLSETLRRYPPAFAVFRAASRTYQVPDDSLIIEKGQQIVIPVHSLHNDPEYYPDPEVFDPERFSPEQKAKRPSGTYLPYGDGPRICIGKRFAEIEMKMALTEILTKYEVDTCEKTEIPIKFSKGTAIVMVPENGVWLKFKNINDA